MLREADQFSRADGGDEPAKTPRLEVVLHLEGSRRGDRPAPEPGIRKDFVDVHRIGSEPDVALKIADVSTPGGSPAGVGKGFRISDQEAGLSVPETPQDRIRIAFLPEFKVSVDLAFGHRSTTRRPPRLTRKRVVPDLSFNELQPSINGLAKNLEPEAAEPLLAQHFPGPSQVLTDADRWHRHDPTDPLRPKNSFHHN